MENNENKTPETKEAITSRKATIFEIGLNIATTASMFMLAGAYFYNARVNKEILNSKKD